MVFVHARNETGRTAAVLADIAKNRGESQLFLPKQTPKYGDAQRQVRMCLLMHSFLLEA